VCAIQLSGVDDDACAGHAKETPAGDN